MHAACPQAARNFHVEREMRTCDLKRPRWIATSATLAMVLLLSFVSERVAASECQSSFEAWVKLSESLLHDQQRRQANGTSGCVPSETVRRELLDGLARCLELCKATSSSSDASPQQTKTLININGSLIAALPLCRTDADERGADWTTKAAPAPSQSPTPAPSVAAPTQRPAPAPPIPVPTQRPIPAPAVAAPAQHPAPAPPTPAPTQRPVPVPPCLQLSQLPRERYVLTNRGCTGYSVLAVVETPDASGKTECKSYIIRDKLTLRAAAGAPPRVNHECVFNQVLCTKNHIGSMFPECE